MSHNGKIKPPKSLEDVSHLFFSQGGNDDLRKSSKERGFIRRGVPVSRGSGQKVEKSFPDSAALKQILCVEVLQICRGAVLVDAQAADLCGADLLFRDEWGNPIFLDIIPEDPREIPYRLFEHLQWLECNKSLFLKVYQDGGISRSDNPMLLIVAKFQPAEVVKAADSIRGARVMLFKAKSLLIDGSSPGILLDQVFPQKGGGLKHATIMKPNR